MTRLIVAAEYWKGQSEIQDKATENGKPMPIPYLSELFRRGANLVALQTVDQHGADHRSAKLTIKPEKLEHRVPLKNGISPTDDSDDSDDPVLKGPMGLRKQEIAQATEDLLQGVGELRLREGLCNLVERIAMRDEVQDAFLEEMHIVEVDPSILQLQRVEALLLAAAEGVGEAPPGIAAAAAAAAEPPIPSSPSSSSSSRPQSPPDDGIPGAPFSPPPNLPDPFQQQQQQQQSSPHLHCVRCGVALCGACLEAMSFAESMPGQQQQQQQWKPMTPQYEQEWREKRRDSSSSKKKKKQKKGKKAISDGGTLEGRWYRYVLALATAVLALVMVSRYSPESYQRFVELAHRVLKLPVRAVPPQQREQNKQKRGKA